MSRGCLRALGGWGRVRSDFLGPDLAVNLPLWLTFGSQSVPNRCRRCSTLETTDYDFRPGPRQRLRCEGGRRSGRETRTTQPGNRRYAG